MTDIMNSRARAAAQRARVADLLCITGDGRRQKAGAGGYCSSHYRRRQAGTLDVPVREQRHAPVDVRFDAKVAPADEHGCKLWTAGLNKGGYGLFRVRTGFQQSAHLYAWTRVHGPVVPTDEIPDPVIDHLCHPVDGSCAGGVGCRHRRCTNVNHMEIKGRGDNSRRCVPR